MLQARKQQCKPHIKISRLQQQQQEVVRNGLCSTFTTWSTFKTLRR